MEPFATIDDLEADGRSLEAEGISDRAASTLINRVTAFLSSLLAEHDIKVYPNDELQAINLTTVTCYIVWDEISKQKGPDFSSLSQSVGSTSVSFSMPARTKGYYVPPEYEKLLGIRGRGGFKMLRTAIRNADGSPAEGW